MDKKALIWANIRHRKGGFISILLLMFMVSFALTSVISVNGNVGKRWKESADAAGVGTLNAFTPTQKVTPKMLSSIRSNKNIEKVDCEDLLCCDVKINGKQVPNSILWAKETSGKMRYNIYNEAETSFLPKAELCGPGEVYLPLSMSMDLDCKVGDKIQLCYGDKVLDKKIKGFMEEPFLGAQSIGVKYALMNQEEFDAMSEEVTQPKEEEKKLDTKEKKSYLVSYQLIKMYQKESSDVSVMELKKQLNKETHIIDRSFMSMSANQSQSYTGMFTSVMSGILYAFAILLFGIVLVVIGHSISSSIEMDYVNIGVLRACGFTLGKLRFVFLIQYLVVEVLGVMLGMLVSIPAIGFLCSIFVPITGLLASSAPILGESALVLLVMLIVASLFIFIKTRRIAKVSPVTAISGGRKAVYFSNHLELKVNGRFLNLRMAFRQLSSNGKQYISVIVIAGLLTFFMLAMGSIKACMNAETAAETFGMIAEDVVMNCHGDKTKQEKAEKIINQVCPIEESFSTTNLYFSLDGQEYLGMIYSKASLFNNVLEGREPKYDNEIVMTQVLSDETGLKIGDKVEVTQGEKTHTMMISGIYQATNDAGLCFGMTLDAFRKNFNKDMEMYSISYKLQNSKKAKAVVDTVKKKLGDDFVIQDVTNDSMMNTIMAGVDMLTYTVYVASILFILVVAAMVCGKVYTKEQVDLGVYRTLGFTSGRLRLQFALRFLLVAGVGVLIGFGANLLWNNALMNQLFRSVGISHFVTKYTVVGVMAPILAVGIGFFLFAFLFSRKARKVNVRSLSNE